MVITKKVCRNQGNIQMPRQSLQIIFQKIVKGFLKKNLSASKIF